MYKIYKFTKFTEFTIKKNTKLINLRNSPGSCQEEPWILETDPNTPNFNL